MIEAPTSLQETLSLSDLPPSHLSACAAQNIPTTGNAAGNTKDLFDLDGVNKSVPPLPAGFTARGIVALVFSCLSAFLGVAIIAWYGAGEIGKQEPKRKEGGKEIVGGVAVEGEGEEDR
ncbi:hypothetical protein MMC28_004891 [Mycoblastus sanguinarius]|nr:hypothetical protein [Mycoblastus sanguinarius]